jgi:hypothetical protein
MQSTGEDGAVGGEKNGVRDGRYAIGAHRG